MTDLHLDCFSGLAGDMFLGACLDLGMPLVVLEEVVASLDLLGVALESRRARRGEVGGTRFRVLLGGRSIEGPDPEEEPSVHGDLQPYPLDRPPPDWHSGGASRPPQGLAAIERRIEGSGLSATVKARSIRLFSRLTASAARVEGTAIERFQLHGLGALDSLVDLVGAAAAVEYLRPGRITSGRVNVGGSAAGRDDGAPPVPQPVVAELIRGMPTHDGPGGELLTPTGAVLLAELVDEFLPAPPWTPRRQGYGLGRMDFSHGPNAVRLLQR